MSLKMKCYSKWNVTENWMFLKIECQLNGMSLKMECYSNRNVTQNGVSPKMEFHTKWSVTQNGMWLKMKFHSNWNVTQIQMSFKIKWPLKYINIKQNKIYKCISFQDWVNFTLIPCLPSGSLNTIEKKKKIGSLSNNLLCKCSASRFCIHWKIAKQWPNDNQFCCLKKT